MSFLSVLSSVGKGLEKFFGVAEKVAVAAEPEVAEFFPGISGLFNTTVTAIGGAETAAIAAGKQNGTGAQKLALVTASVESSFNAYAVANGFVKPTQAEIEGAANAAVAFVNSLNATPAPSTPAATA